MVRPNILSILKFFLAMVLLVVSSTVVFESSAEAKSTKRSSSKKKSSKKRTTSSHKGKRHSSHKRSSSRHHSSRKHHKKRTTVHRAPKYAYPYDFFMLDAPSFDRTPLVVDQSQEIMRQFVRGSAGHHPATTLVRAGVFKYHPLKGGIFFRREPVKYIIMHSTETGNPNMDAPRVINSWNSRGRRHPGAQFVINRDGTIYQAVDPDLGTVHINIFKTIAGINNDNCIGIEMVHSGSQDYPPALVVSAVRLVNYLQQRYNVADENVTTHRYVQQGDHTDPVRFDWAGFILQKNKLRTEAIAMKADDIRRSTRTWITEPKQLNNEKKVEGSIVDGAKPEEDVNLLNLEKVAPKDLPVEHVKHPEIFKEIEEPKPPTTLLQLRGPINLNPEDAIKLRKD